MAELQPITIDGTEYPCDSWGVEQQGQLLKREWKKGLLGGMGQFLERDDQSYFVAKNLDTTSPPWVRLRPSTALDISETGIDGTKPVHAFRAKNGNDEFVYILNDQFAYKIDISSGVIDETKDFGSGAVCGRPVLFEGKWYVPLGASVDFARLDTINAPPTVDSWGAPGTQRALAFGIQMKEGVAFLARAHTVNNVDLSSDGTTFGDDFEVGDATDFISTMLEWQGQLAVITSANVYRFDADGHSQGEQEFVGRNASAITPYDGAKSATHGPFLFWPNMSGLWRLRSDSAVPIGFDSDPNFVDVALDSFSPLESSGGITGWSSIAAFGRWVYATRGRQLFTGLLRSDGTVLWHGVIFTSSGSIQCAITESSDVGSPVLWLGEHLKGIRRFNLKEDGSMRSALGSNRGLASEAAQLFLSETDFGLDGDKQFQLRRFWIQLENWDVEAVVQLVVFRNGATSSEDVGGTITADGFAERAWTAGTLDKAYRARFGIKVDPSASYAPSTNDPRIRSWGVQVASPTIYRARLPLTKERMAGFGDIRTARKALWDLKGEKTINVIEPGDETAFAGQIVDVRERAVAIDGGTAYQMDLFVRRWDWSAAA